MYNNRSQEPVEIIFRKLVVIRDESGGFRECSLAFSHALVAWLLQLWGILGFRCYSNLLFPLDQISSHLPRCQLFTFIMVSRAPAGFKHTSWPRHHSHVPAFRLREFAEIGRCVFAPFQDCAINQMIHVKCGDARFVCGCVFVRGSSSRQPPARRFSGCSQEFASSSETPSPKRASWRFRLLKSYQVLHSLSVRPMLSRGKKKGQTRTESFSIRCLGWFTLQYHHPQSSHESSCDSCKVNFLFQLTIFFILDCNAN